MIKFPGFDKPYTPRTYLKQWFQDDIFVITDDDLRYPALPRIMSENSHLKMILDLSHNPHPDMDPARLIDPTLTGNFNFFYKPQVPYIFFPICLWMYSLRTNLWYHDYDWDAGNRKTKGAMCFNRNTAWHRTELYERLRSFTNKITYTMNGRYGSRADMTVSDPAYEQHAVNIVTETCMEWPYVSEKTAKPFAARQIPILIGSAGINRFMQDLGLDMFSDIVPWHTWDEILDNRERLNKIADFIIDWVNKDDMLEIYRLVIDRVEKNKRHFHSDRFRDTILGQINLLSY